MANTNSSQTNSLIKQIPKKVYIPLLIIVIYVATLFLPFTSLYAQYPIHVVKCGRLPIIASGYSKVYYKPGDRMYLVTPFSEEYFCNSQEAEAAGYHQ